MATLMLSAVGGAIGSSIGGGVLGLSSAVVGRAVGATVGQMVDRGFGQAEQRVLGSGSQLVDHGRLDRLRMTSAGEGTVIPQVYGRIRIAGHLLWTSGFTETVTTIGDLSATGRAGKGAGLQHNNVSGAGTAKHYSYSVSLAIGLCEGEIAGIGRIWADGDEIARDDLDLRVYKGTENQAPDPLIEAVEGVGHVPGYRGTAYVVIENLPLGAYGNRVPQLSFEVVRNEGAAGSGDMAEHVRAVSMIPGTGEYTLATVPVRYEDEPGKSAFINAHSFVSGTDIGASIQALNDELPRCQAVSLVVSWFGDDLRCGSCSLRPKVERSGRSGVEIPWRAGGIGIDEASAVPDQSGNSVYGGTPADGAVVQSIRALKDAGKDVMFYPFILMEQLAGNGLPDPYGGAEQPVLPWRGRITGSVAPGHPGTVDQTQTADSEVAAFFGQARPDDFELTGDGPDMEIRYTGPEEWSFRRFVLHYAHLCAAAGGVESFCIGSELRGLTQLRGAAGFPAVAELTALASNVREILGPNVMIGYAADWSEYFGYHPQDGSGDVYFHLDPLWGHDDIDFIGIDNYMPLSDWRGEDHELDAAFGGPHSVEYLASNIEGGEGYDWYYASDADREAQNRTAIEDGFYGEPWVWRFKDIRNWWSNSHHDRVGGVRSDSATSWVPGSKPIRFTEIGCAAVDKATNQPNKFVDAKSSESALPYYSTGCRDDFVQVQYIRAMDEYWANPEKNPKSAIYGRSMVDTDRSYVWTWDARPFPVFPGLSDVWSDASNYHRGHWITGRSGYRTLASVVAEICHRADIYRIDVSDLRGVVKGYAVDDVGTGRAALQPLMLAYGFDATERNGVLHFRMRSSETFIDLDISELVQLDGGDLVSVREPGAESAFRVSVGFIGETGSYSALTSDAVMGGLDDGSVARTELPLVLTEAEGREIAQRWLSEATTGRDRVRFGLPPSSDHVHSGDVVAIHGGLYRIDRIERSEFLHVEATRIASKQYDTIDTGVSGIKVNSRVVSPPVLPIFMDLPISRAGGVSGPLVAASSDPWRGSVSVWSSIDGSGYRFDGVIGKRGVIGTLEHPLSRMASGRIDRRSQAVIRLLAGDLSSCSDHALLNGANIIAVGSEETGQWEILQFRDAELIAPNTYAISHLLRGQSGTDAVIPDEWPAGSRIVLLDDAVEAVGHDVQLRGTSHHFSIGPSDQAVNGPGYVQKDQVFLHNDLRPLSPVHPRCRKGDEGTEITWVRRTRIDGDNWSGYDVPLAEEAERYLVRVLQDEQILREVICAEPRWLYASDAMAADGAGCMISVSQISASFGPGPARVFDPHEM